MKQRVYKVYYYVAGGFGFRPASGASIAGWFEPFYHDGVVEWHYHRSPGLGHQPTGQWLYEYWPQRECPVSIGLTGIE